MPGIQYSSGRQKVGAQQIAYLCRQTSSLPPLHLAVRRNPKLSPHPRFDTVVLVYSVGDHMR